MDLRIPASSLGELFDCPARWEVKYIKGLRLPKSGKAQLGKALHIGSAAFDQSRLDGESLGVAAVVEMIVQAIWHPEEEILWSEELPQSLAEKIALDLFDRYCVEVAFRQEYFGVSVYCRELRLEKWNLALTGTVDRIRVTPQGELGVAELKSGGRVVDTHGKISLARYCLELAIYELLAEEVLGFPVTAPAQVIGLQTAKTEKARRIGLSEARLPLRPLLLGDEHGPGALDYAARILKSGNFYGNPASVLCNPKACPAFGSCNVSLPSAS